MILGIDFGHHSIKMVAIDNKMVQLVGEKIIIENPSSFDPDKLEVSHWVSAFESLCSDLNVNMKKVSTIVTSIWGSKVSIKPISTLEMEESELIEILNLYGGYLNRGSIFDYLNQTFLLIICNPVDFNNTVNKFNERINDIRNKKVARRQLPDGFRSSHISPEELKNKLMRFGKTIDIVPWGTSKNDINTHFQMPFTTSESFYGKLDVAARRISELSKSGSIVAVVTNQSTRIKEVFKQYNIQLCNRSKSMSKLKPGEVIVMKASETCDIHGFSIKSQDNSIILLSDAEIFGAAKIRRAKLRRSKRIRKSLMKDLKLGDYLVHVDHGIAKFTGTHKDPKNQNEYLILQYALDDKLYVPMESLERVNPYIAPLGRTPHLSRLGSQTWNNTKAKASEATKELAGELLNIYATRNSATGYQFSTDSVWQNQLEDSFPHKETDDQIEALSAIKADMESKKPMDRLICGDVGYGKTEIAIRAAFKTVMEGKQVALLAPTTVLVQQHYVTFSERLSAYPINIEYLSRFRSPKEQKQVINDLVKGKVDICIGTHMLIQPNIEFTDLGLLIIDEEQRFGVSQKEQMKKIRSEVDVITLTATPIPRTLQMSMAGIKDISMVMTPPEERIPIKTYVTEQSDELIRDAIIRELDRGGQVYFVHNRVKDIHSIAKRISNIVPEAKIAVGHGQLNEAELEKTMLDFADGHIDVLICTTIIESGLDIQNANTMIINRAHTFGLAQLYQLRGRIGRGPKRSYAYFLVPDNVVINEVASRRLKTMLAATNLGAGFQIAMADLEIRGAGNILGGQQSGHINAIGYDLYSKMLSEATEQLRVDKINPATKTIDQNLTSINLDIPANIPSSYISDLHLRMDIYKQIIQAKDEQSLKETEAIVLNEHIKGYLNFGIDINNDNVIIDVGANIGIYSVYAALRKPTATVYAFEPEYSNLHQLKQNILENALTRNICPYAIALDENTGISQLHVQDTTPGAAKHTVSKQKLTNTHTGDDVVWREGVATMTLDEFCVLSQVKPNLIKIDVDGTETAILKGGQKTFSNSDLRTVYIEVDKDHIECEDILINYGFVLIDMPSDNQIWRRPG